METWEREEKKKIMATKRSLQKQNSFARNETESSRPFQQKKAIIG